MQPMEPFMPEPITLALGGAALAIPAALGVTVRRAARARTAARAAIFDECRALLDATEDQVPVIETVRAVGWSSPGGASIRFRYRYVKGS